MNITRRAQFWAVIVLSTGIILAGVLILPAYRYAKSLRADRLLAESLEYTEQGNASKAYDRALSAHFLNPESEEILLVLAKAAIENRHAAAMQWWPKVIHSRLRTAEDLKGYVEFLMRSRNEQEAAKYISMLAEEMPEDLEVGLMQVRILRDQRKLLESVNLARNWIDRGYDSPELQESYVEGILGLPYEGFREEARSYLLTIADRKDETGRMALRYLVQFPDLEVEERSRLLAQLQAHPEAENVDRLARYRFDIEKGSVAFEDIREEIIGMFDLEDTEELVELTRWLGGLGQPREILALMDETRARSDGRLFLNYMRARLATGGATGVYEATLLPPDQLPIERADTLLLRAQALRALNRNVEYEETLTNLARTIELKEFEKVEQMLLLGAHWDILETLYKRLLENEYTAALGKRKLLAAFYYLGDENGLLDLLSGVRVEDFSNNPPIENFAAYLNLLHNRDQAESRAAVESLVAQFPRSIDFRLTLAFIYYQEGKIDEAHELIEQMPTLDRNSPRYFLVIATAVLAAHGDHAKAREIFQQIELTNLIPRERRILIKVQQEISGTSGSEG